MTKGFLAQSLQPVSCGYRYYTDPTSFTSMRKVLQHGVVFYGTGRLLPPKIRRHFFIPLPAQIELMYKHRLSTKVSVEAFAFNSSSFRDIGNYKGTAKSSIPFPSVKSSSKSNEFLPHTVYVSLSLFLFLFKYWLLFELKHLKETLTSYKTFLYPLTLNCWIKHFFINPLRVNLIFVFVSHFIFVLSKIK